MKKTAKSLSIIFTLTMLLTLALYSCADDKTTSTASIEDQSSESDVLVPHLGKANYSGKTLRILATDGEGANYGTSQIAPDELNSEPVNDTVILRNNQLEEEYGFTVEAIYTEAWDAFLEKVRNDMMSDSADYDVISTGVFTLSSFAAEGSLLDLYSIEGSHLSLDKEWWDVTSNEDMSIGNKLFFTTGDIFVLDDENTIVTYFNKDIIEELSLENPYDLVYSGEWTLDKMYEMIKTVVKEDGNGIMGIDSNDRWGLVGDAFDTYKYILGCDNPQVYKDNDDLPYLAMTNQEAVDAFMKVYQMFTDKDHVAYTEEYYAWNDPDAANVINNFFSGNSLFYASSVRAVSTEKMRNADIHYGILPEPKYDTAQENYTSTINPYHFYCLSITNASHDLDFITFALEAIAYTSKQIVTPEYYQRTLQLKRFDDQDSPEMLDIIFSNRIVDISVIFNWDDCIQYYNNLIFSNAPTIVSYVDARREAFNAAMQETIDAIMALE
ncbi:MAG TPA: hypothetical protein DDZ99_00505 [Clostridiales bacterium]|nr:hypothetical protein [Clostridiales bacterium]